MDSIEVEGAGQKDSQAVQGIVNKQDTTAATPVPTEIVTVPATPAVTGPAVAVSGACLTELNLTLIRAACFPADDQMSSSAAIMCLETGSDELCY